MATEINWNNINEFLNLIPAKYIDVPWIVPNDIKNITYDKNDMFVLNDYSLVGSAEQGFIYFQVNDILKNKIYKTCTPCFRNEQTINDKTRQYFMKVELFLPNATEDILLQFVETAKIYHTILLNKCHNFIFKEAENLLNIIKTNKGYDILLNDIEIGSYYYNEYTYNNINYHYICGTGIAEPRFSYALRINYDK